MSPLRIVLVLLTLAIVPPVFAGEYMGGDMSNTILAKGKILDRTVLKREKKSDIRALTTFVYSVSYKGRIYWCRVRKNGTDCYGTIKD